MIALAALLLWSAARAQEIAAPGAGGNSSYAYFVMVGPIDAARTYRPWLFSAVAMANRLRGLGSGADIVVLCAARRDGAVRPGDAGARLTAVEESALSGARCRWRYVEPPTGGRRGGTAGYHMGHYKLLAWQHVEYDVVQLLDADLLPAAAMDRLFELPRLAGAEVVACPGKVSALNAGWLALTPSLERFAGLVASVDGRLARLDRARPFGHALPSWFAANKDRQPPGWKFFDSFGNQGHMYSYFRFDVRDLALIFDGPRNGAELLHYADAGEPAFAAPSAAVRAILDGGFPCPFPARSSSARAQIALAYHHFTGASKPWSKFRPKNPRNLAWYVAVSRDLTDAAPLRALFPDVDDHLAVLRPLVNKK